ncbi:MAG TPA: endolytic transglycosylase MltG [Clostridiales bacterium]|nr:endolytic transglycosylase MltG [Clostridiales bacterium]
MKKNIFLIIVLAVIGIGLLSVSYYNSNLQAVDSSSSDAVLIQIPSGSSPNAIGDILLKKELIHDLTVYKIYLRLNDKGSSFKAGDYVMTQSMPLVEIIALLETGGNVKTTTNIIIQEGLTLLEISDVIGSQFSIDKERFLALANDVSYFATDFLYLQDDNIVSLEGYLYPDTYNIYLNSTEENIIRRMLSGFEEVYTSIIEGNIPEGMDLNSIMTMASIVEGEALLDVERPVVASVFYNRIEENWQLESCATVQYALGERKSVLTYEDLEVESDYNTYQHTGLPPGPINSPGTASISAAINPDSTEYMFFLAIGDGSHYFTDNYDDFLKAKAKYINN